MEAKEAVDKALQANRDHQYALKVYIERLEAEFKTVDKMLVSAAVDSDDDTEDVPDTGLVYVEGALKPVSVVQPRMLLSEDSPFFEDAQRRKRYADYTTVNQMKTKEHEALKAAVRIENMRMQTLEAQSRNHPFDIKAFPPEHFERNTEGIDWRRVSIKMNSSIPSAVPRTAKECEIRWLGYLHPSINQGTWTSEEIEQLKRILTEDGSDKPSRNWVDIAKRLGTNRTPIDCMRQGTKRKLHTWTPDADKRLLEIVELYGQNNWQLVAANVSEDATAHQCQKRYFDSLVSTINKGPWTPEEEEQLRRAVAAFSGVSADEGSSTSAKRAIPWQEVALFVPGRTNNQCREHYQERVSKSKTKGKSRTAGRSAKGKEKAIGADGVDGAEEGAETDGSDQVDDIDEVKGKRRTQPKANKPRLNMSGSALEAKSHADEEVGTKTPIIQTTESTPRAGLRPRPRARKRANSAIESPAAESSNSHLGPDPTTEGDTTIASGKRARLSNLRSASSPRKKQDARRSKRSMAPRKRRAGPTENTTKGVEQVGGGGGGGEVTGQVVVNAAQSVTDPEQVHRKRKTVTPPRRSRRVRVAISESTGAETQCNDGAKPLSGLKEARAAAAAAETLSLLRGKA